MFSLFDSSKFRFFLQATNSSEKEPSLFRTEFACAMVNFSSSIADRYLMSEVTLPSTTFLYGLSIYPNLFTLQYVA